MHTKGIIVFAHNFKMTSLFDLPSEKHYEGKYLYVLCKLHVLTYMGTNPFLPSFFGEIMTPIVAIQGHVTILVGVATKDN